MGNQNEGKEKPGPKDEEQKRQNERADFRKQDPDNNLSRGAPSDRRERIEQQSEERAEHQGRSEGEAQKQWQRKPEDLDREDAAIQREGIAGETPGVRPQSDADWVREKS